MSEKLLLGEGFHAGQSKTQVKSMKKCPRNGLSEGIQ
jgi:hypothetical protein